MTVKLCVDWSGMVYLPTGSSDLFLFFSCMTSNFLYLSFSTFYSSSLWRTDTIVFSKLNKPPTSIKSPLKWVRNEYAPRGLNGGFTVFFEKWCDQHVTSTGQRKNLIPWQESNLCMTFRTLVGCSNHWATKHSWRLGHIQGSCMTCILCTDRIINRNYHVCDK